MKILPHELRLATFAELPPREQRECRAVCKTWKEDIDGKWCRVMPKIDESRKFDPLYSFVTVSYVVNDLGGLRDFDLWTSVRGAFQNSFRDESARAVRLPSFLETRRDPQATFEKLREQLPFFASVPGVLALAADPSGTSLTLQGERVAIDYTDLAARYVRGWADVTRGVTSLSWDLSGDVCDWLRYVLPSEGSSANLLAHLPRKRRLALGSPTSIRPPRLEVMQGQVTKLMSALISTHVPEALSVSVTSPQECLLQVSAALALPVRVLLESRRAAGCSAAYVNQLEEAARMTLSSYLGQVAVEHLGEDRKSFPFAVRALLDASTKNQKTVMQMFDRILAN